MSNVIISEKEYRELLYAKFKLDALEAGGINNTMAYEESFCQNLDWWNNEHPKEQYEYWEDLAEAVVETEIKAVDKDVYILWKNGIIQGIYSSYNKAYEAMCAAINKMDATEINWANEDCGFTTVYSVFGEKIEFEISDEYAVQ